MTSKYSDEIDTDQIQNPSEINIDDIQCSICSNVLCKPVACQACETPFCSSCIRTWIAKCPNKCPMKCTGYVERSCPRFVLKQLSRIQLYCTYRSNGCTEIFPYEAFEKHQSLCEYQTQQCPKCQLQIIQKHFSEHEAQCTSTDPKLNSIRIENQQDSTEIRSLKHELELLRQELNANKQNFENQLEGQQRELQLLREENAHYIKQIYQIQEYLFPSHITFSDIVPNSGYTQIPSGYKKLDWFNFQFTSKVFQNQVYMYKIPFPENKSESIASCPGEGMISTRRFNRTFNVVSLDIIVPAQWNFDLTIFGYRNSRQTNIHILSMTEAKYKHLDLNWTDIDELKFCSRIQFLLIDLLLAPSFN